MKKQIFLLGAAAALFTMASCSSSDDGPKSPSGTGEAVTSYLSVNILSPNEGTRAGGDQDNSDTNTGAPSDGTNNPVYEEGFAEENDVTKVRFYFFGNNDQPINVHYNESATDGYDNYYDYNTPATTTGEMPNVEKIISAKIVLNTKYKDKAGPDDGRPTQIVAIVNPPSNLETTMTISQLKDLKDNFASSANTTSGSFMMINSVYAETNSSEGNSSYVEKFATPITDANFYTEEQAATSYPVDIYVERAVAKARVEFASAVNTQQINNATCIKLTKPNSTEALKYGDTELYLKLSNWDVTCTPNIGNLVKSIDTSWTTSDLWSTWTYPAFFRSFWAKNPEFSDPSGYSKDATDYVGLTWPISWSDINTSGVQYGFKNGSTIENSNIRYMNENAPQVAYDPENNYDKFTKIILAGQLVDESGNPVTVVEYGGTQFVAGSSETDKEIELKKAVLSNIQANQKFIYVKEDNTYKSLSADYVEFKTAKEVGVVDKTSSTDDPVNKEYGESGKRFNVYAQLKEKDTDGNDITYYSLKSTVASDKSEFTDTDFDQLTTSEYNTTLVNQFGKAKIWNNGMTYYYITIQHLNGFDTDNTTAKLGTYGVVRNHIYECAINGIAGFGTPVYDENEIIIPEKPGKDEWMLAARIRILSWRVVKNSYSVAW